MNDDRVRIPADVDQPDRILAGLTARQLGILSAAAVLVWAVYQATGPWLALSVQAAVAAPIVVVAVVVALGERDGLSGDRYVLAAWRWRRSPARLVPADEAICPPPGWLDVGGRPLPAPLDPPAKAVDADGVIDLGAHGTAVLCEASAGSFGLRTHAEQQALVAGFGRWLNAADTPVQIVVRSRPLDLRDTVDRLRHAAGGLAHPALETAAREHADFLESLTGQGLLQRQTILVLRDPGPPDVAGDVLARRAQEAQRRLAGAGVSLRVMDRPGAEAALAGAAAATPALAGSWHPGEIVHGAPR